MAALALGLVTLAHAHLVTAQTSTAVQTSPSQAVPRAEAQAPTPTPPPAQIPVPAQSPSPEATDNLRRQVLARFDVVPLAEGVALSGRTPERRIEIDNGIVMSGGVPLSGEELRRRLGADAALVLRLSYLDNPALRRMFAPPAAPATPVPPVPSAAPAATPAPAAATPPPSVTPPPEPAVSAPPAPGAPDAPGTPGAVFDRPSSPEPQRVYRRTGARLAFGKSIVVAEDEDVTEGVVALAGSVRIEGRVRDEVVVIGGDLELAPTADVRGDLTVFGGRLTIAPGARHSGAVHHGTGGGWQRWQWPAVRWVDLGGAARWVSLAGTVTRVALLALAVTLVTFLARGRVARVAAAARTTPVRAGLIGLAAQLLFVPALIVIAVAMAVTIVGLPFVAVVIPLAVVAMGLAMLLGFASLAQTLGQAVGRRFGWTTEAALWASALGMAVIVLPTLISRVVGLAPESARAVTVALMVVGTAVEYVAWTIGLGAAVMTGLGRWAVVPPPLPPTAVDAPSAL